jgi:hypothetical protein
MLLIHCAKNNIKLDIKKQVVVGIVIIISNTAADNITSCINVHK